MQAGAGAVSRYTHWLVDCVIFSATPGVGNGVDPISRAVSNCRASISCFLDRGATSYETRRKKYRALAGLFFFAVSRRLLKTSPMPRRRKRVDPTFLPYIYSQAELKRLLAAIP